MDAFLPMLKNVLLFVLLAVPGYILVKGKLLKQEQSGVLSKLLMYVGMPFLIVSGTIGISFDKNILMGLLTVAILGTALTFAFYFVSFFLAKCKIKDNEELQRKRRGMMRFAEVFSNNGFLGLPLALAIGVNPTVFAYLVLLNIINNVMIYTLGMYLISGDKNTISLKNVIFNPVLIGFIVGIIINLTGVTKSLPEITTFSDHFKNLVTPISMLILGMKMGAIKFSDLFKEKTLYVVSAVKLILLPVVTVAITFLVSIIVPIDKINVIMAIFIAFAMPTAGLATAFADKHDGDVNGAVIYILGTTIISVLTIPVLYALLNVII